MVKKRQRISRSSISLFPLLGASACTTCEAGHYCDQNATTQAFMYASRICPAGVECPPGMARQPDLVSDKCRVGHYCPAGDVSAYPVACPEGTYNPDFGRSRLSASVPGSRHSCNRLLDGARGKCAIDIALALQS